MKTSLLDEFHSHFPPSGKRIAYEPGRHAVYAERVSEALAHEWLVYGYGAYSDGLLRTPEPDSPLLDPEEWSFLDGSGIEILVTAFAGVLVWQGGELFFVDPHAEVVASMGDDIDAILEFGIVDRNFRKNVLMEPIFAKVVKKLGALDADECYGFAPLPALGGSLDVEHVIKTELRSYLSMAAQSID